MYGKGPRTSGVAAGKPSVHEMDSGTVHADTPTARPTQTDVSTRVVYFRVNGAPVEASPSVWPVFCDTIRRDGRCLGTTGAPETQDLDQTFRLRHSCRVC